MKCTDQELSRLLCEHGQSHVLRFWDTLEPGEQASLAQQVRSLDLDLIDRLYRAVLFTTTFWSFPREFWPPGEQFCRGEFSVSFRQIAQHAIMGDAHNDSPST